MTRKRPYLLAALIVTGTIMVTVSVMITTGFFLLSQYESRYENRIYPMIRVGDIDAGGKSREEIRAEIERRNEPLRQALYELSVDGFIATASGEHLGFGYDATLAATQAYMIGRSGNLLSDFAVKISSRPLTVDPMLVWDTETLSELLNSIRSHIDIPAQEGLFDFKNGKVTQFRPSENGRGLDVPGTKERIRTALLHIEESPIPYVRIPLEIAVITPATTTESVNTFGIRERIGRGFSVFTGSIPGRIHNVALAASRLNGILIPPGQTFSFNSAIGDISAATGYQSAYIIKDGRTVLGDGGGVCQVSTTLFRAALDAGLPIVERRPHAYRVHYYEDGGYKPGLDATVFYPTADLKVTNDTPAHILIQTTTDTRNLTLTFDLFGTSDGRKSEILNHTVWDESPPPPPVYQDDPTLPSGIIKQVDWSAWGAKANFQYRVTRNGETIIDTNFPSTYRPWQAVYLKGVQS